MNESESLAERIRDWELLLNSSRSLLEEASQLAEPHAQFLTLVEDVKAHADRELSLRGQAAMSVSRRKVLEAAARAAKSKLVAGVRGFLGTQNDRLLEFGIPIGKVGRRAKATQAAGVLAPPVPVPDVPVAAGAAAVK
jgi:hypothetical protein